MRRLILLTVLLIAIGSCKKIIGEDDKLSIQKMPFTSNQLRINGYYYRLLNNYITVHFLYANGTVLHGGTFPANELNQHEADFKTAKWQSIMKKHKYQWGSFKVDGSTIWLERWNPSEPPLRAYIEEGNILNDTSFALTRRYREAEGPNKKITQLNNEVWRFKEFSSKPDSTNKFIQ